MNSVTEEARLFVASGFLLLRRKGHLIWRCPCGHALITDTGSRAGGSARANNRARIRRTLRECERRRTT